MGAGQDIFKVQIFDNEEIAAGDSAEYMVDLNWFKPVGVFALQVEVAGDGTIKGECLSSINGTDFVVPTGEDEIFTGFTSTSGTSGKDIFTVTPVPSTKIKIRLTETGGSNTASVSAWLLVQ